MTIGYFIPRFPGQTHIFFWREARALAELGIQCDFVSSSFPKKKLISHSWAQEAMERTTYLSRITFGAVVGMAGELLRCGPLAWMRCIAAAMKADGLRLSQKFSLLGAGIAGGTLLSRLARQRGWSHVHVHSCAESANIALFAHLLSGLPYSMTLHGPLSDYGKNQKQKWRHANFAIVITKKLLAEVREQVGDSLPEVVEIAPMGVELHKFNRSTPYQPFTGSGPAHLFACGRLTAVKGHDDLVKAVALLKGSGFDVQLKIAGEDQSDGAQYRKYIEKLISELGLSSKVTLLGAVSEESVRQEIESAHVFALASWHEPLGVAIMEAMAMQAPVVTTGAGGVKELVDDGVDGLLVDPKQPQQLADAIARILRDPELAQRLSNAGRKKIEQSFHSGVSAQVIARNIRQSMKGQTPTETLIAAS